MLACDGTHIGVSLRQMNLRNPVTRPDPTLPVLDACHQRYNRILLTDTHMRKHPSYLSRKYLRKLRPEDHLDANIEAERTREFQQNLGAHCDQPVKNFILALVQRSEDQEILYYIARILYMLSGDAAMDAVVPFLCNDVLNTCITDVHKNTIDVQSMDNLKYDGGIDIVKSLELGIKYGCISLVTEFWEYVQKKVEKLHKDNNRPALQVARIPNTYGPSSGSAYYFSEHGEQIHKMPEYRVSGRITVANYDEQPFVDGVCNKKFPRAHTAGFGYLFLWFCPIHGHAYGFHLIQGGEGHKDPFASLYKYLETPPKDVFYDFACQLSEYCLNREPELFKKKKVLA